MKIAIIGATGMLGHHTALAAIQNGHRVIVVHRPGSNLARIADLEYTPVTGDLNDSQSIAAALSDADVVINCAAYYPTKPRPWQQDVELALKQMNGFYAACARLNLKKIVYLGAAIALKKNPTGADGHADLEYNSQPTFKNGYLQCKWAMDRLARTKAAEGLPVVIAIPSMTFGEFDYGPTTGRLICEIANGTLPAYVHGNRNVIYAGDAGRGLLLAVEKGRAGERYLFTGENYSMRDLVALIARLAQVAPPKPVPLTAARLVSKFQSLKYKLFGGQLPKLDDTAIAVLSSGQFLESEKARNELGWAPKIGVEEAIRRALTWFQHNGYIHKS